MTDKKNFEIMDLATPNFTNKNSQKIADLFPNCVVESGDGNFKIDFDALRQELSADVVDGITERYQMTWPGKAESIVKGKASIDKTLRPIRDESVDFDTTQNLFIEGDNLDALKLLQETYLGKVKMIYIDPPYNTGNDLIYDDNIVADKDEYAENSDYVNEDGGRLVSNPDSKGRFHSDWLSMIYPRLRLAKNLLSDDGVIFISIDDNEQANLKKLCDEVFLENNFVGVFAVENNPKGRKNSDFISVSSEYCLVFARSKDNAKFIENIPKKASDMVQDENGDFVHASGKRVLVGENKFNNAVTNLKSDKHYTVYYNKKTDDIVLEKEDSIEKVNEYYIAKGYKRYISFFNGKFVENTYAKDKFRDLHESKSLEYKNGKIFEKNFNSVIRIKSILENQEYEGIVNGKKQKVKIDFKTTSAGTYLKQLFNTEKPIFSAPKSTGLIKIFLTLFESKDFIVLDFFSGSGTTADAIMQLNAEDSGNRKCISVQLPECLENSYKNTSHAEAKKVIKNAMEYLRKIQKPLTISEITKKRIRLAGVEIAKENKDVDIGFRVLKIDSGNRVDVKDIPSETSQDSLFERVSNFKKDRTPMDLLFGCMLDWGVDLSLPIKSQTVADKTVYGVYDRTDTEHNFPLLMACFDDTITDDFTKTIATDHKPMRMVFKDASFKNNDSAKINTKEIFKTLSPETDIKVI